MFDIFENALKSPAGSFAFIISILAVCFIAIWKVSHFTTKFKSVEKLEDSIDGIKENMHYVKASLKMIIDSNNPLAQRNSPVSMTRIGETVAEEISLNNLIINHWDNIYAQLTKVLSKECNSYDIQVESFKIGEKYQEFLNKDELKEVKNHAFKSGFNLEVYNLLFGIAIRDKYLSIKGIDKSDIDLYDPISKSNK
ncbi:MULTISPECIES: hypothetical protein [Flavobacterium]|uniref:LemA family protein n=1 Tax=Flavobacterium keumense TaxID=1306518 RepID=A0ABY8N2D5_9FLAO|nr:MULTISPECIES: hypothetical protein [Flavobacterium]WGK93820.1 hypothetical protein MG292_06875 [Flavobacterium keumense]